MAIRHQLYARDGVGSAFVIYSYSERYGTHAYVESACFIDFWFFNVYSVCGIVLVAIGSNLKVLADNCHTTATHIGTVFIVRGIGAVVGAVASAKLYVQMLFDWLALRTKW